MLVIICIFVIIVVILFILAGQFLFKEKTRQQFFEDVERLVDGRFEPIENQENSFQIKFHFEDYDFVYEDIEVKGFNRSYFKGFLKVLSKSPLTFNIVEKERQVTVRSNIVMASHIVDDPTLIKEKLCLPDGFEKFQVSTNDALVTNKLFEDSKFLNILNEFKNSDKRGYCYFSLKIVDGVVILEFTPTGVHKPNLYVLRNNTARLENYVDKLKYIAGKLNDLMELMRNQDQDNPPE